MNPPAIQKPSAHRYRAHRIRPGRLRRGTVHGTLGIVVRACRVALVLLGGCLRPSHS